MLVAFDGQVAKLRDIKPASVFITRHNQSTLIGITAVYGNDPAVLLLNAPAGTQDLFPRLFSHHHMEMVLQDPDLAVLPDAVLIPNFSLSGLEFQSSVQDGPGMLTITTEHAIVRAARPDGAFVYVDVKSGNSSTGSVHGVEIPRWAIKTPIPGGVRTIFEFDGPKPRGTP